MREKQQKAMKDVLTAVKVRRHVFFFFVSETSVAHHKAFLYNKLLIGISIFNLKSYFGKHGYIDMEKVAISLLVCFAIK